MATSASPSYTRPSTTRNRASCPASGGTRRKTCAPFYCPLFRCSTSRIRLALVWAISFDQSKLTFFFNLANVDASVMYRRWKESNGKDEEYKTIIVRQVKKSQEEAKKDNVTSEFCNKNTSRTKTSSSGTYQLKLSIRHFWAIMSNCSFKSKRNRPLQNLFSIYFFPSSNDAWRVLHQNTNHPSGRVRRGQLRLGPVWRCWRWRRWRLLGWWRLTKNLFYSNFCENCRWHFFIDT